jgi:hypothetical protein
MGIIHYAYYFDRLKLLRKVPGEAVQGETLERNALRTLAARALEACPRFGKDFLESICFDEDWLDISTEDIDRNEEIVQDLDCAARLWLPGHERFHFRHTGASSSLAWLVEGANSPAAERPAPCKVGGTPRAFQTSPCTFIPRNHFLARPRRRAHAHQRLFLNS